MKVRLEAANGDTVEVEDWMSGEWPDGAAGNELVLTARTPAGGTAKVALSRELLMQLANCLLVFQEEGQR